MKIMLDFDGTIVEHQFPKMGRCNFGCFEVIKKIQDAGHEIILNTYRADIDKRYLDEALNLINNQQWRLIMDKKYHPDFELNPITEYAKSKVGPYPLDFEDAERSGVLFIDDQSLNTPLKEAVMSNGMMVDWDKLELLLIENGIINN